ncbi:MAG TPA: thymidine kinase [Phnomibacter sp.]|nr:thymidine kinase [Phnomibacter sp.]
MFIEPTLTSDKKGWIEVICGSMFSGKTEELIRRLKRARIANLRVEIFKPAIDVRYDEVQIVSHDANAIQSTPIDNSQKILLLANDVDVIGIDEAQFFDDQIVHVCQELANRGTRVIVAGLDMDYMGQPFGQMPFLLSIADYITKLHAICVECGTIASFSYRIGKSDQQILLGEKDEYQPLCRKHYYEKMNHNPNPSS